MLLLICILLCYIIFIFNYVIIVLCKISYQTEGVKIRSAIINSTFSAQKFRNSRLQQNSPVMHMLIKRYSDYHLPQIFPNSKMKCDICMFFFGILLYVTFPVAIPIFACYLYLYTSYQTFSLSHFFFKYATV